MNLGYKAELKTLHGEFLDSSIAKIIQVQKDTQMEDEQLATVLATIISSAMSSSIGALQPLKQLEMMDQQILTEVEQTLNVSSETSVRNAQSTKDLLLKDAQIVEMTASAAIKEKELLLKDKELLLKDKELLMQQAQIDLATAEIGIREQDLLIKAQELLISQQELLVKTAQVDVMVREIVLKESQSASTIANVTADTAIKTYQHTFLMPAEKAKMEADALVAATEVDIKAKEILIKTSQLDIMGREITLKETESASNVANVVAETSVKISQKVMIDQQTRTETEQTAKAAYEVINLLPAQKDGMLAETAVKTTQASMIDQQTLTEVQQTTKAAYEVANLLPLQKSLAEEHINSEIQKQESMIIEDTVRQSQKSMIDQQKLTEAKATEKASYEVTNILPIQKDFLTEQKETEMAKQASMAVEDGLKGSQKLLVDQQVLTEAQDTVKRTNEATYVVAQKDVLAQQKLSEVERTKQELYKATTLLVDEHTFNTARTTATTNQALLYARQTAGFDDKLRIEEAEKVANAVGMIYASGGDVPADAWTLVKSTAAAITPA